MIIQYSFDLEILDDCNLNDQDIQNHLAYVFKQSVVEMIGFERQCSWKNKENYSKNIQN